MDTVPEFEQPGEVQPDLIFMLAMKTKSTFLCVFLTHASFVGLSVGFRYKMDCTKVQGMLINK